MTRLIRTSLVVLIGILAGCAKRETAVDNGVREQILHLGNGSEPQDLDPQTVTGVPEHNIIASLLEGLVSEDPVDLHPVPGVAERWDISADGRVYTFHLRENAKWSNGDQVTAHDFVRSFRRILTPALASEYAYMLHVMKNAEAFNKGELTDFNEVGARAIDDFTLEITLDHSTPYFLSLLNHYSWFPVHLPTIEKHGEPYARGNRWTRAGNFVGNGPFMLKRWDQYEAIVVEKNPFYWDADTVRLNAIHFHPIESDDVEERAFRSGRIHATYTLPLSKIDVYRMKNSEQLVIAPYLGSYFYRINTTKPPLNDVRVRRALAMAVDRESIVTNITKGGQLPANFLTPPGTAGYTPEARLPTDPERAAKLLAEAGYPNGEGFPTIEILFNTLESHKTIAEAIQQMWKKHLNIDVQLLNQEWKVYLDAQDSLNYDICRAGWIGDYVDPNTFLDMWVTDGGNNDTGWSNPAYNQLIKTAAGESDAAKRLEIFQRAEALLMEEAPIIPIYIYTRVYLKHPALRNWHPTILDHHPYKHVYLEADKQE